VLVEAATLSSDGSEAHPPPPPPLGDVPPAISSDSSTDPIEDPVPPAKPAVLASEDSIVETELSPRPFTLEDIDRTIETRKRIIERKRKTLERMVTRVEDLEVAKRRRIELDAEIARLEASSKQFEESRSVASDVHATWARIYGEISEHRQKMDELKLRLVATKDPADVQVVLAEMTSVNHRMIELTAEYARLTSKLDEVKKILEDGEDREVATCAEIAEVKTKLREVNKRISEMIVPRV
jgi:uncharacterized coiled-coil DUF342 family protein